MCARIHTHTRRNTTPSPAITTNREFTWRKFSGVARVGEAVYRDPKFAQAYDRIMGGSGDYYLPNKLNFVPASLALPTIAA